MMDQVQNHNQVETDSENEVEEMEEFYDITTQPTKKDLYENSLKESNLNQSTLIPIISSTNPINNTCYINSSAFEYVIDEFKASKDLDYFEKMSKKQSKFSLCIKGVASINQEIKNGMNGALGHNGKDGEDGKEVPTGVPGSKGSNGTDAYRGQDGQNGFDGNNGASSNHCYVKLERIDDNLQITGAVGPITKRLYEIQTIFFDLSGEDGINGGKGGNGGNGGNGGRGGDGSKGGDADITSGFKGGDGGDAGNGGDGGDGGNGGKGGNGGNGGNLFIEVNDAKLLMLITYDLKGGKPGQGGLGGKGGSGGKPGRIGLGGKGGQGLYANGVAYPSGADGVEGKHGQGGKNGVSGTQGSDGVKGETGSVYYKVKLNNDEIEYGSKIYNLQILDYKIKGELDDGIFEPGETIEIDQFVLYNDGDLSIPYGSQLNLKNTHSFLLNQKDGILIEEIKSKQKITKNQKLQGKIMTDLPKKQGIRIGECQIISGCELFGKDFPDSFKDMTIQVQYPIQIEKLSCFPVMSPGEITELKVDFTNISKIDYGIKSHDQIPVKYKIILPNDISFLEQEGNEYLGSIEKISTQNTAFVKIKVKISDKAKNFQRMKWRVDLIYKDQEIQTDEKEIRICQKFNMNVDQTDLLFISNPHITFNEYNCYQVIFESLNLVPNIYDLELYQDEKDPLWIDKYRGKTIIFPQFSQESILKVRAKDIISHFTTKDKDFDSGFVIIGKISKEILYDEMYKYSFDEIELPEDVFSDYYLWNNISEKDRQNKCKKIENDKTNEFPSKIYKVFTKSNDVKKSGWFTYSYGKAVLKTLPLNRCHRLIQVLDPSLDDYNNVAYSSCFLSEKYKEILAQKSIFSTFKDRLFEVILAIVYSLSIDYKLKLLKPNHPLIQKSRKFLNKENKKEYNFQMILQCCMYQDLKQEFFFTDRSIDRVKLLFEKFKNEKDLHFKEGIHSFWYLISRLLSHTFWRSCISPSLYSKRSNLELLSQECNTFIKKLDVNLNTDNIKIFAENEKEDKERLKFPDIITMILFPLEIQD